MNKTELIRSITVGAGVTTAQASKMLTVLQETVSNVLAHGDKVAIRGFGNFSVSDHSARRCRHPQSGEVMFAPAYKTVRFVPSGEIKGRLN